MGLGTGTVICPKCEIILVACSKCDWWAAFVRDELIAAHGADYAMPNLLNHLAAPSCPRLDSQWDRCGVHYVELALSNGTAAMAAFARSWRRE
jgi:hypothetical protein